MSIKSAVLGSAVTLAVVGGGFVALVVANAQDAPVVVVTPSATVTVEPTVTPSATPTPTPTVAPAPEPSATTIPEAAVTPKPKPAPAVPLVQGTAPPAGSGAYVVQPGTVMPSAPPGVYYVPPPRP